AGHPGELLDVLVLARVAAVRDRRELGDLLALVRAAVSLGGLRGLLVAALLAAPGDLGELRVLLVLVLLVRHRWVLSDARPWTHRTSPATSTVSRAPNGFRRVEKPGLRVAARAPGATP